MMLRYALKVMVFSLFSLNFFLDTARAFVGLDTIVLTSRGHIRLRDHMHLSIRVLSPFLKPSQPDKLIEREVNKVLPGIEETETRAIICRDLLVKENYSFEILLPTCQKVFDALTKSWVFVDDLEPGKNILISRTGRLFEIVESFIGENETLCINLSSEEPFPIFITEKELLALS